MIFQNFTTWNTTEYQPHLFLKFSSSFDSLMDDIVISRKALESAFSDSNDGRLGLKDAWDYAVKTLNTTDRDEIMRFVTKTIIAYNFTSTLAPMRHASHNG